MFKLSYFERLTNTVMMLVRHPEYPNKRRVLEQTRREVTELIRSGRLTVPEAEMLFEILDGYPLTDDQEQEDRNGCPACAGASAPL